MSTKTTKCRISVKDNETLKTVALKLSAEHQRVITTSEVLHAIVSTFERKGEGSVEGIINAIRDYFTRVGE